MAQLRVGDLIFNFKDVRTAEYSTRPVYDRSGLQWECSEITLDIVGVVSEVAIATNKPRPNDPGGIRVTQVGGATFDNVGDSLPYTIWNTKEILMQPRQLLQFSINGVTVIDLPAPLDDGTRLACDVKGGPFPQRASYTNFSGEKLAILHYRVVAYDSNCDNYMLSHAWRIESSTDAHHYTVRTTVGCAVFRRDYLDNENLQPDDFRNIILPFHSEGMRRVNTQIDESDAGEQVVYTIVDREITTGLGANSQAVEIVGSFTAGVDAPIKDLKSAAEQVFGVAKDLVTMNFVGVGLRVWSTTVPTQRNSGTVRAIGRKNCSRSGLAALATNIICDRFWPLFKDGGGGDGGVLKLGRIACIYVTHNVDTDHNPYAEVKMEILGLTANALNAMWKNDPTGVINTDNDYDTGGVIGQFNFGGGQGTLTGTKLGPRLIADGNTRGSWAKRLIAQALVPPGECALPDEPPADTDALTLSSEV